MYRVPNCQFRGRVEFQGRELNYSYLLSGTREFAAIYECKQGCLGERKGIVVGCYSVGLKAFL